MVTPEQQGSEPIDSMGSRRSGTATGRSGLNVDRAGLRDISAGIRDIGSEAKNATRDVMGLVRALGGVFGGSRGGGGAGRFSSLFGGGSHTSVPVAGSSNSPASAASGGGARGLFSSVASSVSAGGGGGGGGGGAGGLISSAVGVAQSVMQPLSDLNNYTNQRINQGADYSLQADRMSVQLQQMYGMSNSQVRNQLRMPLTSHYLLGGGTAINDLLAMQANTGLTAKTQASTVEALRTVSGFSYGTQDITRMLSTMASPDVANRMFMMGGTGMYGIGGKERTGMQSIQDIVRRTGLTNPEALKGALQQGSNTRQRLTAMGVPQDMQDMVIQYAMQNSEYQKKTGGGAMYDPSMEGDRKTMGIEGSYAVQHEKTTGERIKREERFYGRQVDNFADFEKNLRSSTKMLAAFEDRLSTLIGLKISTKGHPLTNIMQYGQNYGQNVLKSSINFADQALNMVSGDPVDGMSGSPVSSNAGGTSIEGGEVSPANEKKLAQLDSKLAVPLRQMLLENPKLYIGDARRSTAEQESGFRKRYRPTQKPISEKSKTDRVWNGVVWEMKPDAVKQNLPAMAPPGQSNHEVGLAADVQGDHEWVRKNAARFGLVTGYTGSGGPDDEPFHVEPAGISGLGNKRSSVTSTSSGGRGSVRATSARNTIGTRSRDVSPSSSMGVTSPNAGSVASQLTRESAERYNPSNFGPSKYSSFGGDPVDNSSSSSLNTYSSTGGTGGMSITISPTIHLNGGTNMSSDMRRIAQEVGRLLEDEVKLRLMRRT